MFLKETKLLKNAHLMMCLCLTALQLKNKAEGFYYVFERQLLKIFTNIFSDI